MIEFSLNGKKIITSVALNLETKNWKEIAMQNLESRPTKSIQILSNAISNLKETNSMVMYFNINVSAP